MRSLSLGRTFDGILAWDSFFHLSHVDQRNMFPVFREHAAQRAALMFTSGPDHSEAIGIFEGEPLYHASLDGAEYRALLAKNGFAVAAHAVEDRNMRRPYGLACAVFVRLSRFCSTFKRQFAYLAPTTVLGPTFPNVIIQKLALV